MWVSAGPSQAPDQSGSELSAEVAVTVEPQGELALELALTRVFVRTSRPMPEGAVVTVGLKLSDGVRLKTMARVVSVLRERTDGRAPGMELEFIDVWGDRATRQLAEYMAQDSVPPAPLATWLKGVRVLVVDDDKLYRDLAAKVMQEAGFEVITAVNGFEALSLALKHPPNLVLSDVTMPGLDGWQFLRMIRARATLRRTPVIFLTELNSEAERLRGYQFGVDDYLAKPFSNVELIARVERVLERANMAEQAASIGIRGDLTKVSLASLLSLAEMERRTGVLQLASEGESATLHLREGAVVRIDLPEPHDRLEGIARFFHVLDMQGGRFELIATDVLAEDVLRVPTHYVLLEHARISDEAAQR
jgi:DNA-binding response OmpR family regulator